MSVDEAAAARAAILYNPQRVALSRLRRAVGSAEAHSGHARSLWIETDGSGTDRPVREALDAGPDVVIAAGGDGTVRQVGAALAGTGVPLGIIPSGTANLLARNLGIPQYDIDRAAHIAFTGDVRAIDLGVLTYRLDDGASGVLGYFVMAGFGIDADMVAGSDPNLKRRFGWVAYIVPILRSLGRTSVHQVEYSLDGGAWTSGPLHSLIVGNSGTVTAGLKLLPAARLDDGVLDVLAIRSMRPRDRRAFIRWLSSAQRPAIVGRALHIDPATTGGALRYEQGATLTAVLDRGATFQADGDALGSIVSARFDVRPGAVLVRAPSP